MDPLPPPQYFNVLTAKGAVCCGILFHVLLHAAPETPTKGHFVRPVCYILYYPFLLEPYYT